MNHNQHQKKQVPNENSIIKRLNSENKSQLAWTKDNVVFEQKQIKQGCLPVCVDRNYDELEYPQIGSPLLRDQF